MSTHHTSLVSFYHDGELHRRQLHHFEAHLAGCPICQKELATLRRLSHVLEDFTIPVGKTSPERFSARIRARLPARQRQSAWRTALQGVWQAAPALLFGTLTFGQAVLMLSGAALTIAGLSGSVPWPRNSWLVRLALLFGAAIDHSTRSLLQLLGTLSWFTVLELAFLGIIGLLYWGWLASWWAYHRSVA
ncbi:MAG: anti-sigma factor [Anaerolineae bacterium]|nr:anti-sigma factor [Anaerolineae bacterium]